MQPSRPVNCLVTTELSSDLVIFAFKYLPASLYTFQFPNNWTLLQVKKNIFHTQICLSRFFWTSYLSIFISCVTLGTLLNFPNEWGSGYAAVAQELFWVKEIWVSEISHLPKNRASKTTQLSSVLPGSNLERLSTRGGKHPPHTETDSVTTVSWLPASLPRARLPFQKVICFPKCALLLLFPC